MSDCPAPPEVLPTDSPASFDMAVRRAADLLRRGEIVALPTETVYGLAANALDSRAVARVFEIKGRPPHNPVIVHVADGAMAKRCVRGWPTTADRLAAAFWPGPLTLVLPRGSVIPDIVTAGGDTVGLRWPSHPLIQAVIRACGFPLAAPSANPSNTLSPTTAEHVRKGLGAKVQLIVDGGSCQVGIESTVVDLTTPIPRVLRPGMIHETALASVLGEGVWPMASAEGSGAASTGGAAPALRSPGLFPRHYSPRARLEIWPWRDESELRQRLAAQSPAAKRIHLIAHSRIPTGEGMAAVSVIPHDAEAFARAIYAELHRCDDAGADLIVVEALPDEPAWRAIADRLRRAAGHPPS